MSRWRGAEWGGAFRCTVATDLVVGLEDGLELGEAPCSKDGVESRLISAPLTLTSLQSCGGHMTVT